MARVTLLAASALAILCRRPGFRRAGVAHPARAEYPAGHFTEEQLLALDAEPMLQLTPIGIVEGEGGATGAPSGPVPQPPHAADETAGKAAGSEAQHASPIAETGGDTATGAAPLPSTDAPRSEGGEGSDATAATDGPAAGAASTPAPASSPGDTEATPPQPAAEDTLGGAAPDDGPAAASVPKRGKVKRS